MPVPVPTEADLQAGRYKEDPKGVLQWFIEHPDEASAWEKQVLEEQEVQNRKRSRILTVIGLIVWGFIFIIVLPYALQRLHP